MNETWNSLEQWPTNRTQCICQCTLQLELSGNAQNSGASSRTINDLLHARCRAFYIHSSASFAQDNDKVTFTLWCGEYCRQSYPWLQFLSEHKVGLTLPLPIKRILHYVNGMVVTSFDIDYRWEKGWCNRLFQFDYILQHIIYKFYHISLKPTDQTLNIDYGTRRKRILLSWRPGI